MTDQPAQVAPGLPVSGGWPRLRAHWQRWWMQRQPPSHRQTLTQRNVYILPTRAGWMLTAALAVLLLASINLQLNLGYLLTFLLAGSAVSSMHIAHANLRGMALVSAADLLQPHGSPARFSLTASAQRRARHALRVRVLGSEIDPAAPTLHLAAHTQALTPLSAPLPPGTPRGSLALPPVILESVYPLGLFRVWAHHRPAAPVLLYPAPEQAAPPLPSTPHTAHDTPAPRRAVHPAVAARIGRPPLHCPRTPAATPGRLGVRRRSAGLPLWPEPAARRGCHRASGHRPRAPRHVSAGAGPGVRPLRAQA